jgi:DNA-directed RNA polymerase subunit RPC12/RpoP
MYDDDIDEYADEEDKEEDDVRCARCRKWIPAFSIRCPECGVRFEGQAQDYEGEEDEYRSVFYGTLGGGLPLWIVLTALVLLALMILGIFQLGFW